MKINLNRSRCEAFGSCQQVAPRLYRLDEEGDLQVAFEGEHVPADHEAEARAGARACPVAALRVED